MERIRSVQESETVLDDAAVQAEIERYLTRCLDLLEAWGSGDLPPLTPEISDPDGRPLRLAAEFAITDAGDAAPSRVICPDGTNGDCWREQRTKGGRTYWVWVCNCY